MTILRQIKCDIVGCDNCAVEVTPNSGWPGWGQLNGVTLNGADNPHLCPTHLSTLANCADKESSS